jgi:hypothetical protein
MPNAQTSLTPSLLLCLCASFLAPSLLLCSPALFVYHTGPASILISLSLFFVPHVNGHGIEDRTVVSFREIPRAFLQKPPAASPSSVFCPCPPGPSRPPPTVLEKPLSAPAVFCSAAWLYPWPMGPAQLAWRLLIGPSDVAAGRRILSSAR